MNTSNTRLLTIANTNTSTDLVTAIKVDNNMLRYKTTHSTGWVELIDSTGDCGAINFVNWMKETVVEKTGKESNLIDLVVQYVDTFSNVELRNFKFNGALS